MYPVTVKGVSEVLTSSVELQHTHKTRVGENRFADTNVNNVGETKKEKEAFNKMLVQTVGRYARSALRLRGVVLGSCLTNYWP